MRLPRGAAPWTQSGVSQGDVRRCFAVERSMRERIFADSTMPAGRRRPRALNPSETNASHVLAR
eukprot:11654788-Alexandrium_andersonii.AAC.1